MARKKAKARIRQTIGQNQGQVAGRDIVNRVKVVVQVVHDHASRMREQAAHARAEAALVMVSRWRWLYVAVAAGWVLDVLLNGK